MSYIISGNLLSWLSRFSADTLTTDTLKLQGPTVPQKRFAGGVDVV